MTSERRHVVFVSQMFPPDKGGNASRIHDNAVNVCQDEWNVTVLAPPPSIPPGEFDRSWKRSRTETFDGVTVHRLWTYQPQTEDPGMVKRLLYYLLFGVHCMVWLVWNSRTYDVVVTSTPPISTGGPGLVASVLGKPWVVDVRDLWIDASIALGYLEPGSALERVSRRFQRLVLHTADRITVTTEQTAESIKETYGETLGSKILHLPNGVSVERFRQAAPQREQSESINVATTGHEQHGFTGGAVAAGYRNNGNESQEGAGDGPDPHVIIYTGNLGSAQDLESCIRAMDHLETDNSILRLVGGGDRDSHLREIAHQRGLSDRVEFVEPVPREAVPSLLQEASVGLAPLQCSDELAYAIPTKVYEYLACGLPVVATGSGEVERFVSETGGGVVVDNDERQIAKHIDELLRDDSRRRALGEQGRAHVVQHYDREEIAARLSAALSRLLDE